MPSPKKVSLSKHLIAECLEEVRSRFPLESGGAYMGCSGPSGAHITHVIGPGPNAEHCTDSFKADAPWQWAEMERIYNSSNGTITYLGDWHSHPKATSGRLSYIDRAALGKIVMGGGIHIAHPLSAVFFGGPVSWRWCFWAATRLGAFSVLARVRPVDVEVR